MAPPRKTLALLKKYKIPTLLFEGDTYSVASEIHSIKVKIKPEDKQKIDTIVKMVNQYVDIDKIVENISN